MKTTLSEIRKYEPCAAGWQKLLTYLGKAKADDEPLSLLTILDSNGIDDALWCLRAVEGYDREIRLFAVWCARQVQHVMTDQRSLDALDVAERYANGDATVEELNAARSAARAARSAAMPAAVWWAAEAARSAAAATSDAARAAARATEWAAARYAEWSAADVAGDEMRKRQEAELRRICEEARGE